jgi:hypothetical protein
MIKQYRFQLFLPRLPTNYHTTSKKNLTASDIQTNTFKNIKIDKLLYKHHEYINTPLIFTSLFPNAYVADSEFSGYIIFISSKTNSSINYRVLYDEKHELKLIAFICH